MLRWGYQIPAPRVIEEVNVYKAVPVIVTLMVLLLCGAGKGEKRVKPQPPQTPQKPPVSAPADTPKPANAPSDSGGAGNFSVSVAADVTNVPLASRADIRSSEGLVKSLDMPKGRGSAQLPPGSYKAYIYVVEQGIPLLVDIRDVNVGAKAEKLAVTLLEGTSGEHLLRDFDQDFDLAIDRVELAAGTNPKDPTDTPGHPKLALAPSPVLAKKRGWYRGELHAQSKYGAGTEDVAALVRRAEALKLDFLAIADPNTMAAAQDPEFRSSSVVLIPAMTWGDDRRGYALAYGPVTLPEPAANGMHAQAVARLVQVQGGFFAAAHPCFPKMSWQWDVPFLNGIEVWCRDWGVVPPTTLAGLDKSLTAEAKNQRYVYSIAAAANTKSLSANGQASLFWDYELVRGRKIAPIAGSMTGSPKVPMGQPLTYVFAEEKSVRGILDGMRAGRTFVTAGPDAPTVSLDADVLENGRIDAGMGGAIPAGQKATLIVSVMNAKGKKVEVLENGHTMLVKNLDKRQGHPEDAHFARLLLRLPRADHRLIPSRLWPYAHSGHERAHLRARDGRAEGRYDGRERVGEHPGRSGHAVPRSGARLCHRRARPQGRRQTVARPAGRRRSARGVPIPKTNSGLNTPDFNNPNSSEIKPKRF